MGKIVFVGLCHLRTFVCIVHKCFMERFLLLTMFIGLYGTAPRFVSHNVKLIFHCDAKLLGKICVGDTNTLGCKNAKICVTPCET